MLLCSRNIGMMTELWFYVELRLQICMEPDNEVKRMLDWNPLKHTPPCSTGSSRLDNTRALIPVGRKKHGTRHTVGLPASRLTLRQAVPHFQPVVLALALWPLQRVVFQVKGSEGECDLHVRRDNDDESALQVVRVLVREAGRLDHAWWTGEVSGAVGT